MSADDRREVIRLINEWNSSRYELFALSQPNEHLEFHGVMRFYFQDAGEKVSTKCIRVDSTASTDDVIKVLIEKFRPDMKSLSSAKDYAIYEVHADSQERKLDANERPLWIQLDWGKDGREGRFLLKNENAKTVQFDTTGDGLGLLRDKKRMSKRDKKKQQKQMKDSAKENKINVAEHLYKEVPDSNFTRSISNPEIVMARRRQQKLENKLKQIKNRDGGGTLKVYGETLKPDIPYKTLLMSNQDTAAFAVKETLEKYGLPNEEPDNYCLVQVVTPTREEREKHAAQIKEYILEDNACPLSILMKHPSNGGTIIFQIRRCTPDILAIRKAKKKAADLEKQQQQQHQQQQQQSQHQQINNNNHNNNNMKQRPLNGNYQAEEALNDISNSNNINIKWPCLIELTQEGFELQTARVIQIKADFYEIGNDKYLATNQPNNYIRLDAQIPGIEKKHCVLKKSNDGMQLFLIPLAETYINDRLVKEPTQLMNNFTIRLGKFCLFRLEFNSLNEQQNEHFIKPNIIKPEPNKPQQQQPVINTPINQTAIPPNYGTLYDNGQISNEQQVQRLPVNGQQQMIQTNVSTSQLNVNNMNAKPSEGLPGLLEFPDDGEDALLSNICSTNQLNYQFKLAPVYTMYMMLRFRLSQKYKSDLSFNDKLQSSGLLIHKMVNYIREAVDTNHSDKQILPFWLANSSELLYFLKQDIHLSQVSYDAQELLADCVQITFKYLVNIMQQQLDFVLIAFFDPSDHVEEMNSQQNEIELNDSNSIDNLSRPTLKHVIQVLNETMNLLRGSRVNAALTIQLFSQLFHYISVWMFNKLVSDQRSGLCSRYWGAKLTRRLSKIQLWAEKQGLELAADCHLARIIQAGFFLQASKQDNEQDLPSISSNCFTLNSLQFKCLLSNYVVGVNEPPLSGQLCNNLISIAQSTADEVVKQEGRNLQLHEEIDLQLPFLLPEDGHSCDIIKGLPACLLDFLEILQNSGHCWLWQNTQGPGSWKKFMIKEQQQQLQQLPPLQPQQPTLSGSSTNSSNNSNPIITRPSEQNGKPPTPLPTPIITKQLQAQQQHEDTTDFSQQLGPTVVKLKLAKKNNGLGLSIVAARGTNQINSGIYVKSVVPGGAADDDGRLDAGDQLLAVDEASLINVTQERAAELMCKSGPVVVLTVAKEAAYFHDLDALLNKSPLPAQNQKQQQSMTASMPLLNNVQQQTTNQVINHHQQQQQFSSVTLPRNHLQQPQFNQNGFHSQQQHQQQIQQIEPIANTNSGYRVRSMSQEILRPNGNQQAMNQIQTNTVTSPINRVQPRQQVTSPIRALPNEQMRYGSERPVSMHSQQYQYNQQMNGNSTNHSNGITSNISQRSLHNEFGPRYGSERPSSALASNFFTNHGLSAVQRLNNNSSNSDLMTSPIRQITQNGKFRQASLSELDEINYNNNIQNENKFDDLYGRVNTNRQSSTQISYPQQQVAHNGENNFNFNKTTRVNNVQEVANGNEDPQRANKPFGQLYEQIWANNQNNTRLIQTNQRNIDELNNFKQMEITNGFQQRFNPDMVDNNNMAIRNKPPPSSLISSVSRSNMMNGNHFDAQQRQPRNYENQIINHQQQRQFNAKPAIPSKPFNLITQTEEALPPPPIQSVLANAATAKLVTNTFNNKWENEQVNRLRQDEETRLDLLRQRMDLLHSLETKTNRTNEEENKLNKLRTEIEFDKRVIEMNNLNSYMQDNEETETEDYSPDVRERLASQMLKDEFIQRRRKLENGQEDGSLFHAQKIDKRFVQFEDTQNEMKRDKNQYNMKQQNGFNQFEDSNSDEQTPSQIANNRPQKHVQFMSETEIMSPKYSSISTSPEQKQQQYQDENITPPQQQKRVMFSETSKFLEFDRVEDNINNQHTPCVIGANEIYVDQRLKQKQQQQQQQQMANMFVEGEKLSFKDKMKLFAMQSGENLAENAENKFKVSKKQREIESKFEIK